MNFKELLRFIKLESKRLVKKYGQGLSSREIVLSRTVKLNEEVGELCAEILALDNDQRKEKLSKMKEEDNLPNELADVVITTLLLAEALDVDIKTALRNKIEKINKRYK